MKKCCKCKKSFPLSDFWKHSRSKDGLQYSCKHCGKVKQDEWLQKNSTKRKLYSKDYEDNRRKRPEGYKVKRTAKKRREYRLKSYGLTLEQLEDVFVKQGSKCKICNSENSTHSSKGFVVDHCHVTGRVRGLLCNKCNLGLGNFKDSVEILEKALSYLKD